jgi:hypothetical protein
MIPDKVALIIGSVWANSHTGMVITHAQISSFFRILRKI